MYKVIYKLILSLNILTSILILDLCPWFSLFVTLALFINDEYYSFIILGLLSGITSGLGLLQLCENQEYLIKYLIKKIF